MKTGIAYFGVLFIWSTTPLAIKWSSQELGFLMSVSARMIIAALLSLPLVILIDKRLPISWTNLKSYFAGSIGIFGAMLAVYWAAQTIPSALISILFGLAPLVTGAQAYWILGELFSVRKLFSVLVSLSGLVIIFIGEVQLAHTDVMALIAMLVAVNLYCLSSITVKRISAPVTPLQQTCGSLWVSSMGYIALCASTDTLTLPIALSVKTLSSLLYLSVICSLLGFFLYFYILSKLSAGIVSLVTLITPVFALMLGLYLNNETFSWVTTTGSALILIGLLGYQANAKSG